MLITLLIVAAIVAAVIREYTRGHLDLARLGRLALSGAIAGLIIFAIFNPGLVRDEQKMPQLGLDTLFDLDEAMKTLDALGKRLQTPDPYGAFMFVGFFSAMLGGLLLIVDEIGSPTKRIIKKALLAAAAGVVIGGTAGVAIDQLFTHLCRGRSLIMAVVIMSIAQPFGWLLIGVAAGIATGVTLGSRRRLMACVWGGLLGGFIGGNLFSVIGTVTSLVFQTGTIGRMVGIPAMGAAIGASLAFIEDVAKRSWVTVLSGPKEGRSYILSKPETIIGRDELADIGLFGDPGVAKRHASLLLQGYVVTLQATGGEVAVNGAQAQSVQLRPWDMFTVGRYSLRFHQKGERQAAPAGYSMQPYAQPMPQAQYGPPPQTVGMPAVGASSGCLALVAVSGPYMNQRFTFSPGSVRIGRDAGCAILLSWDTMVSRNHAELAWSGSGWVARDLGSRNGLWVNGVRTAEHVLNVGDQIGVGQTWLRVEAF